jgi:S1-C subfamily serine protease
MNGELIEVNSAIFSQSGGNIGIGFAIAINMAKQLLPQLTEGKIRRSWIGVMIQNVNPELKSKLDLETFSRSPAGVKERDAILFLIDRGKRDLIIFMGRFKC